ncbi:MAG: hypothetical protein NWQ28_14395 [Nodularia sp. (in: cyanobacteria)]|nr:hypothetical protein [Nodularia sp. (in: cyanobacteria)]
MLSWSEKERSLSLVEFDRKSAIPAAGVAIAYRDEGKTVIPVWLDVIYQRLSR